jgi:cytochrome P450
MRAIVIDTSARCGEQHHPFLDPPEHDTPRRLIGRAFAKKMRHQPPDLKAIAEEFLAPLRSTAEFDVLQDFGTPFAIAGIGRTLGVPPEEEALLKEWSHWFFYLFMMIPSQEVRQQLDEALTAFRDYFKGRLAIVRQTPDESLLTGLAESGLSDAEIVGHLHVALRRWRGERGPRHRQRHRRDASSAWTVATARSEPRGHPRCC